MFPSELLCFFKFSSFTFDDVIKQLMRAATMKLERVKMTSRIAF